MGAASLKDWVLNRLGANPPKALVDMRDWGTLAVLAACGIPLELFSSTQGTAAREAFRRFLHATVTPLLAAMAAEAARKLDKPGLAFRYHGAACRGRGRAGEGLPVDSWWGD